VRLLLSYFVLGPRIFAREPVVKICFVIFVWRSDAKFVLHVRTSASFLGLIAHESPPRRTLSFNHPCCPQNRGIPTGQHSDDPTTHPILSVGAVCPPTMSVPAPLPRVRVTCSLQGANVSQTEELDYPQTNPDAGSGYRTPLPTPSSP
jgi:hypothetical protein